MQDLIIVGAGGFAREIALLVDQINSATPLWTLLGFYDINATEPSSQRGVPIFTAADITRVPKSTAFAIGIGAPESKRRAVNEVQQLGFSHAPALVHPAVHVDDSVKIEPGAVVCNGVILTVDIVLRPFSTLNLGCTIGHDSMVGQYAQLSPGCNISGKVRLEEGVFMGTNASTVEEVTIGPWSKIGAGAMVLHDIPANSTAVGVPAKVVKAPHA